jgi:putative glutathione S-transferase
MQRIYEVPGMAVTVNPQHIKAGYYSIAALNPSGIAPEGPLNLWWW